MKKPSNLSDVAPITLFAFNRLQHTRQTVDALKRNEEAAHSRLIVFCDGPRDEEDVAPVRGVREYLRSVRGFREIVLEERSENLGLARSIVSGVTAVINDYGRTIVVEDDLECSPHFLSFMNRALERFESEERVAAVHGYLPPIRRRREEAFFLRFVDCWGWGTWRASWRLYEHDAHVLLERLRQGRLERLFDINGSFDYTGMLQSQVDGGGDSWAIRWYASAFLEEKLGLFPGRNLIQHIGWNEGTHFRDARNLMYAPLASRPLPIGAPELMDDERARAQLEAFYRSLHPGRLAKIKAGVARGLGRLRQTLVRHGHTS